MKLEVYMIEEDGSRTTIWSDAEYAPKGKGSAAELLNDAVDTAIKTVIVNYFDDSFGFSKSSIGASAGVLKQRIKCFGHKEGVSPNDGHGDSEVSVDVGHSREFEVELRLDADALKLKALTGVRIKRVRILNLRSIHDLTIDLNDNPSLMLIAGLNGAGKSSVLEAIAISFMTNSAKNYVRPLPEAGYKIEIDFADSGGSEYKVEKTAAEHVLRDGRGCLIADTGYELRRYFADIEIRYFSSSRNVAAGRATGMAVRRGSGLRMDGSISGLCQACINEYINLRLMPKQRNEHYLDRLNAAWRRFYPENDSKFVIAENEKLRAEDRPGELVLDMFLSEPTAGNLIPLKELSSGENEILTFISTLMIASHKADIVLIDEPELHLNRVWHAVILDALVQISPGSQFVAATHSRDLWKSVYSWNRIYLDGGEVTNV